MLKLKRSLTLDRFFTRKYHSGVREYKSNEVRKTFVDFFGSHPKFPHVITRSAKVVPPTNDPTLPFINSGMSPFKKVFLGQGRPPGSSSIHGKSAVANVQKCVRVAGKHNDLEEVGKDGSHHTFFEMLGNWSFNQSYFKIEACSLAWELLVNHFKLPKEKLYVSYFGGSHHLPADLESRDNWRKIGVREDHILPFTEKENFWEMGAFGPCGPCTEIHFDHQGLGPKFVNAGRDGLVEIWNLVFMEYQRHPNGLLEPLPRKHVDTGMGFERLVAVLNAKTSNYDTDLFQPLFHLIESQTKMPGYTGSFSNPLDTCYRILADHSRMIAVCLSDGMFPEHSPKLKQVLRRTLKIAKQDFFQNEGNNFTEMDLLKDLCKLNAEILGEAHSEMLANMEKVEIILDFERETLKQLELDGQKLWPKLVKDYPKIRELADFSECKQINEGLKVLDKEGISTNSDALITGDIAFKLYESHGFKEVDIEKLAKIKGVVFSNEEFAKKFLDVKSTSRTNTALKHINISPKISSLKKTDDKWKYLYTKTKENNLYEFPIVYGAKILSVTNSSLEPVDFLVKDQSGVLFLDKTPFYSEAGGQQSDIGEIVLESGSVFVVKDCQRLLSGQVAHIGNVKNGRISSKSGFCEGKINTTHRLKLMQSHSGCHLLNGVLNLLLPLTCQKSSNVGAGHFKFDFGVFKQETIDINFVKRLETIINELIASKQDIIREVLELSEDIFKYDEFINRNPRSNKMDKKRLITIPGETYPEEQLCMIHTPISVEPCCGTHVSSTADVHSLVVTSIKTTGPGVRSMKCFVGAEADEIRKQGIELLREISKLQIEVEASDYYDANKMRNFAKTVSRLEKKLVQKPYPYAVTAEAPQILSYLSRKIKSMGRSSTKADMEAQLSVVLQANPSTPFVIHAFRDLVEESEKVNLSKLTKLCQGKPILVVAIQNQELLARACVPLNLIPGFKAESWLKVFADEFNGKVSAPKGKNPNEVVNMKPMYYDQSQNIESAMEKTRAFAADYFQVQ